MHLDQQPFFIHRALKGGPAAHIMPIRRALACLAAALFLPLAQGADALHPWQAPPPLNVKEAYFSNLDDGAEIETPFLLKFGLTGMGLAPIVKAVAKSGHHHLLVNRELPLNFNQPLPFDDRYIHFGQGQMETVLNLAPGKYKLRLVMADHLHIPNFVYSKPLNVTVKRKNESIQPESLVKRGVAILSPQPGESMRGPFRLQFHASGLNVSHASISDAGAGHFRVRIKPESGREELIDLSNGHTEVWLSPPAGAYSAKLEFVGNAAPAAVQFEAGPVAFKVER
jgi:hypothetical protein